MIKRFFVDLKWARIGQVLRAYDPSRYEAVLGIAEDIVSAYREAGMWEPARVTARNDNL